MMTRLLLNGMELVIARIDASKKVSIFPVSLAAFIVCISLSVTLHLAGLKLFSPPSSTAMVYPPSVLQTLEKAQNGFSVSEQEFEALFDAYSKEWKTIRTSHNNIDFTQGNDRVFFSVDVYWNNLNITPLLPYAGTDHKKLSEIAMFNPEVAAVMSYVFQQAGWYEEAKIMQNAYYNQRAVTSACDQDCPF